MIKLHSYSSGPCLHSLSHHWVREALFVERFAVYSFVAIVEFTTALVAEVKCLWFNKWLANVTPADAQITVAGEWSYRDHRNYEMRVTYCIAKEPSRKKKIGLDRTGPAWSGTIEPSSRLVQAWIFQGFFQSGISYLFHWDDLFNIHLKFCSSNMSLHHINSSLQLLRPIKSNFP